MALILEINDNDTKDVAQENSWLFNSGANSIQDNNQNFSGDLQRTIKVDDLRIDCKDGKYYILQGREWILLKDKDTLLIKKHKIKVVYDLAFSQRDTASSDHFYNSCGLLFSDELCSVNPLKSSERSEISKATNPFVPTTFPTMNDSNNGNKAKLLSNDPLDFLYDQHYDLIERDKLEDNVLISDNNTKGTDFSTSIVSSQLKNTPISSIDNSSLDEDVVREEISNEGNILRDLGFFSC